MSLKAWSEEDTVELTKLYLDETQDVNELAEHFGKGYRSVISKLVQLKIYKKPEEESGDSAKTVKIMLRNLEKMLDIEIDGTNLNKKSNLIILVEAIEKRLGFKS